MPAKQSTSWAPNLQCLASQWQSAPSLEGLGPRTQGSPEAVVGVQVSAVSGAVQVLCPLQRGGHEEQKGPVHALNGSQVTPAAGTEPCFGLGVRWEVEGDTHTFSQDGWMGVGGRRDARAHTHTVPPCAPALHSHPGSLTPLHPPIHTHTHAHGMGPGQEGGPHR